mgnify:CR=1 FL=1
MFTLRKLKIIPDIDKPTYTFAHIICPHRPFVFDKLGNDVLQNTQFNLDNTIIKDGQFEEREFIDKYVQQTAYLNKLVLETVDTIIAKSDEKPIIIIQADHGPGSYYIRKRYKNSNDPFRIRMAILNAYYFPDKDYSDLYSSISPVNSFRVILNKYFDTNLDILEDKSYYSTGEAPFDFKQSL